MKIDQIIDSQKVRVHPYIGTVEGDDSVQYYDFVNNPELIPQVLEDYKPYENYEAIQKFYQYLTWLNTSDESLLESTDCAFHSGQTETNPDYSTYCRGRVMYWFKNHPMNLDYGCIAGVQAMFAENLQTINDMENFLVVEIQKNPIQIMAKPHLRAWQVIVEFVVFGNGEDQAMVNLSRFYDHLKDATHNLSNNIKAIMADNQ